MTYLMEEAMSYVDRHAWDWVTDGVFSLFNWIFDTSLQGEQAQHNQGSNYRVLNGAELANLWREDIERLPQRTNWTPYAGKGPRPDDIADDFSLYLDYRNHWTSNFRPISPRCPLPQTGDPMMDEIMNDYWMLYYENGLFDSDTFRSLRIETFQDYYNKVFVKGDKIVAPAGMNTSVTSYQYKYEPLRDAQGNEVKFGVSNPGKLDMNLYQGLMKKVQEYFASQFHSMAGISSHDLGSVLMTDGQALMKYIQEIFNNQMLTMRDVLLQGDTGIGNGNIDRGVEAIRDMFEGFYTEVTPINQFAIDLSRTFEQTVPNGGFEAAFDVKYQVFYAPELWYDKLDSLTEYEGNWGAAATKYLEWYKENEEHLSGLPPEQILDYYSQAHPDQSEFIPHFDISQIHDPNQGDPNQGDPEDPNYDDPNYDDPDNPPPQPPPPTPEIGNDRFKAVTYYDDPSWNGPINQMILQQRRALEQTSGDPIQRGNLEALYDYIAEGHEDSKKRLEEGALMDVEGNHENRWEDII
jgi:hypothetical protein